MNRLVAIVSLAVAAVFSGSAWAVEELPLPSVPVELTTPSERASYIVAHFWNGMEFGDTVRSRDIEFVEQNFVNYLSLFPYVAADSLEKSVRSLMKAAEADAVAYNIVADMADKYLYDVDSPMFDEEAYLMFLRPITEDRFMESNRRSRFDFELEDVMKNRQGTVAADFQYVDNKGAVRTLHDTGKQQNKVLFFYDPECENCHAAAAILQSEPELASRISAGTLSIVAIYAEGDREMWETARNSMPEGWINGYSPEDEVELSGAYSLRQTPTIYLLAPDNTVLLKDTTVDRLIEFIKSR